MARSKSKMPTRISPMLCTLTKEPPRNEDYLFEVKWDGYRIVSFVRHGEVRMDSRSGLNYTSRYPVIADALKKLGHEVILDGEVVVFNDSGNADFDALQKYNGIASPISYCVFDLLWLDGNDLRSQPLTVRKELLKQLVRKDDTFHYSESYDDGQELYQRVLDLNMEGIVAKRKDSEYIEGERAYSWLKIPTRKRQEFVIGGWAESEKARSFKSLLFGAYENGRFTWIGRGGGGFKDKEMPVILKQLEALEVSESPFVNEVLDTKGAKIHWVKPQLVANFEFATWTKTGRIRKPATFLGFRSDKRPEQVVREVPKDVQKIDELTDKIEPANKIPPSKPYLNAGSNWRRVDEAVAGKEISDFPMANCTIQLHDVGRELWKGIPKGELILYYNKISKFILPHIQHRPQSLNLKLTHAGGPTTFIKDMENRQPDCAEIFIDQRRVAKKGKRKQIDYLVCNNIETLLSMVDWGCVDINPWASQTKAPEFPDYIWLDLDPTVENTEEEDQGFEMAIEVAGAVKEVLDKFGLKGSIKTSGKTGLHVYIPVRDINFDVSLFLGRYLADQVNELVPDISTRSITKAHRKGKVYIDADQNNYADTLATVYSVRPYHQPTVSTPLDWKEVKSGLDRYSFTINTIEKRLEKKGDVFLSVLDEKIRSRNYSVLAKLP